MILFFVQHLPLDGASIKLSQLKCCSVVSVKSPEHDSVFLEKLVEEFSPERWPFNCMVHCKRRKNFTFSIRDTPI